MNFRGKSIKSRLAFWICVFVAPIILAVLLLSWRYATADRLDPNYFDAVHRRVHPVE